MSSSFETIKENYKKLILQYHPDKNVQHEHKFVQINEAWNVLKNEGERKLYDAKLLAESEDHMNIYKSVLLSEMGLRDDQQMYVYPCRCGECYEIETNQIEDENIIVACDTCSLLLEIVNHPDNR